MVDAPFNSHSLCVLCLCGDKRRAGLPGGATAAAGILAFLIFAFDFLGISGFYCSPDKPVKPIHSLTAGPRRLINGLLLRPNPPHTRKDTLPVRDSIWPANTRACPKPRGETICLDAAYRESSPIPHIASGKQQASKQRHLRPDRAVSGAKRVPVRL